MVWGFEFSGSLTAAHGDQIENADLNSQDGCHVAQSRRVRARKSGENGGHGCVDYCEAQLSAVGRSAVPRVGEVGARCISDIWCKSVS